jgi:hypothetical protein
MPIQFLGSSLLETIICLILVFALLSLLVSTIAEILNSYFNERGRQLYSTISRLFDDNINVNFGQLLYSHPMITNLRKDINSLPQYISDTMFSQVLVEVIGNYARTYAYDNTVKKIILKDEITDPFTRFYNGVLEMKHTGLKLLLLQMAEKSIAISEKESDRIGYLEKQVQQWYNSQMDRSSGWFKTNLRKRLIWIAFFVTIALNVDSITLFITVYKNPVLRDQLNTVADKIADNYAQQNKDTSLAALQRTLIINNTAKTINDTGITNNALTKLQLLDSIAGLKDSLRTLNLKAAQTELNIINGLGLPIGWHHEIKPLSLSLYNKNGKPAIRTLIINIILYLAGIAITTFSISSGAPFWFDLLLKFVNIRRAGKKPEQNA